jgi:hypothetical protein
MFLFAFAFATACSPSGDAPEGMVWVPGGEFTMGSDHPMSRADERPPRRVSVQGFWMDATEVTNAQFAEFVRATGYVTVAERPVDWDRLKVQLPPGTPRPDDSRLQPGSLVFTPPSGPVDLDRHEQWWSWVPGADWRHPRGPGSSIDGRADEPVVHVCHDDAEAYARWAGRVFPRERLGPVRHGRKRLGVVRGREPRRFARRAGRVLPVQRRVLLELPAERPHVPDAGHRHRAPRIPVRPGRAGALTHRNVARPGSAPRAEQRAEVRTVDRTAPVDVRGAIGAP